jgi:hypothetical protein
VDHALVRSVIPGILKDQGHLLENLVFVHLRRESGEIYYYRTARGNEVDFIAVNGAGAKRLIQVCSSLQDPETRKREVSSLLEAMKELGIRNAIIVTFEEIDTIRSGESVIEIVPAYKFLVS